MAENVGMTYEQWLQQAKNNAAQTRDTAISNANINYQKSKSEYGNKAEALRNMGLTGAGYSDYLNSQAYAQMQGAISNANAQYNQNIADIDTKYMDYINQKEEAAKANYANLLSNITYNWTDSDIDNYAGAYGLSPEQVTTLKQTRMDRVKRFLDTNDYDINTLKMLLPEDSAEYKTYLTKLQETPVDASSFYGADGNLEDEATARGVIEGARANGQDVSKLEEAYSKAYSIGTLANGGIVTFNSDGGRFKPDKEGDNFEVAYTTEWGGESFKVQNGGIVTKDDADKNALKFASKVNNNQVFYYNGKLYMKYDGDVYRIEARNNAKDFNKLIAYFEQYYSKG